MEPPCNPSPPQRPVPICTVLISGKRSDAVLVSSEDWSAIQETLYLLAVPGMRESIKAGMAEPLAQSATGLDW